MKQAQSKDILEAYSGKIKWFVGLIAALLYINTLNHQMALDDYSLIVEHKHVQNGLDGIDEILTTNCLNGNSGANVGLYRPLSLISFALEKEFLDNNTSIAHGINIILYSFSAIFLFLVLQHIFAKFPLVVPLAATLLFVAHPLHTEVVANIKGRDELFAFAGFVLALFFFIKRMQSHSIKDLGFAILFFIVALFSKESAVVYAIAIPLLLLMKEEYTLKKVIPILLILLPFVFAFALLRYNIVHNMENPIDEGNFGILNNPIAAAENASMRWGSTFSLQVLFLQKIFFAYPLIYDYSYNLISLESIFSLKSIFGILVLLGLSIAGLSGLIKKNILGLVAALYILSVALVSQILLLIGTIFAERLLYLSILAFGISIPFLVMRFSKNKNPYAVRNQKNIAGLTILLVLFYGFQTINRNMDWKNNYQLYQADIEHASNSARANYNFGSELSDQAQLTNNQQEKARLFQTAAKHLQKATQIYPEYLDAYNNLGIVYKGLGNYPEAIKVYIKNIKLDPSYTKNYYNLATAYYEEKQFDKAVLSMQEYVNRNPNNANAYFIMGQAAGNIKDFQQAISYLNQAINISPNHVNALNFLGMAHGMLGNYSSAEPAFKKAISLAPTRTDVLMNLALSYNQQGKSQEELNTLKKILSVDPNHQLARQQLQVLGSTN